MKPVYSSGKLGSYRRISFIIHDFFRIARGFIDFRCLFCYDPSLPLVETKMEP